MKELPQQMCSEYLQAGASQMVLIGALVGLC